ncbi:hypothetical protein SLEP1_g25491 [Rubroshorea leprosula]|uniref:Uncharacterized protein n=1 Tax=Rubroshorea leprosula TaxID=152421 RepID=A0AAV5JM56_9ROSI|nr:hypothetical protein SLEP1_g25491 [Rubroshorea leprosula]
MIMYCRMKINLLNLWFCFVISGYPFSSFCCLIECACQLDYLMMIFPIWVWGKDSFFLHFSQVV